MQSPSLRHLEILSEKARQNVEKTGKFGLSCELLALEMAEKLREEGKEPTTWRMRRFEKIDGKNTRVRFQHVGLPGLKPFMNHSICIHDGLVYDPLMGKDPIPIKEYQSRAFEKGKGPNQRTRFK